MRVRLGVVFAAVTVSLALPGFGSAQLPEVPLPEVPDLPLPEVPETPTVPTLPGITSPPASPPAPASDGGSTSGEPATSGSSGSSSGSSRSRGTASSRDSGPRTRFDRLPRRYETLLERILRGQNVDANLRRLERALGNASPELRARIERLVRREIAALERGSMTPEERRRVQRLERVLRLFAPTAEARGGAGTPVAAGSSTPLAVSAEPRRDAVDRPAGVASAGSGSSPKEEGAGVGSDDSRGPLPGLPSLPDDITIGTVLLGLLLALLVLAALAFALAAAPSRALPRGRVRQAVRTSRSSLAFTGLVVLGAMMVMLLIGALV